jgi:hypothetical protein
MLRTRSSLCWSVHDDIRGACAAFPAPALGGLGNPDCMGMVFSHEGQSSLAHTLY